MTASIEGAEHVARSLKLGLHLTDWGSGPPDDTFTLARTALGLGVSGPQVVEGWYGQPIRPPLARTRERRPGRSALILG